MHRRRKARIIALFSGHAKEVGIIITILIIAVSYGLFFYQQNITEESVRNGLFIEQRERQLESTKAMAQHIGSDLSLVASILQGLSGLELFAARMNYMAIELIN